MPGRGTTGDAAYASLGARALVTGSNGFIGRHLCEALRGAGYWVKGLDRDQGVDIRRDLREYNGHWDVVVHAAAVVGGRRIMDNAPMAHAQNLAVDAQFFRWAEINRPGRVVYFSSSCAYPVAMANYRATPLKEAYLDIRYPAMPDRLYGWAKLTGEMLAAELTGIPVTIVRPFSVYGPGIRSGFAVSGFLEQARKREDPIVVWGDPHQTRDYIWVGDVAAAVTALIAGKADGAYNLGTGIATPLETLARMIGKAAGYRPGIKVDESMPAGSRFLVADTDKLAGYYRPTMGLAEGLERMMGHE